MVTPKFKAGQWVNSKLNGKAGIIEFTAHMLDNTPYNKPGETKEEAEIIMYSITWEDGVIDEFVREDELE